MEETKPKDTSENLDKKLPAEDKEPQAKIPQDDSNLQTVKLYKQDDTKDPLDPEPEKKGFLKNAWKNIKDPTIIQKFIHRFTPCKGNRPLVFLIVITTPAKQIEPVLSIKA